MTNPHADREARRAWLRRELARHDRLYHGLAAPEISDEEYDALAKELYAFEGGDLHWLPPRLDAPPSGACRHDPPMLSLRKVSAAGMTDWAERIGPVRYVVEPKFDGVAAEVVASPCGTVALATTRGDGVWGNEITDLFRGIELDACIRERMGVGFVTHIRGELISRRRDGETSEKARHRAAGAVRRGDPEGLLFVPWGEVNESGPEQSFRSLRPLPETLCFAMERLDSPSPPALLGAAQRLSWRLVGSNVPTDGVVVKVLCPGLRAALGATRRYPRWAVAIRHRDL